MSYRFGPSGYGELRRPQQLPSARVLMLALLGAFVVLSLIVLLAGRLPFTPTPPAATGPTYREYVAEDRALLDSYGYTLEGRVHIPIERAIELIVERGLPTR